ncbi:hypothetical protein [Ruegeria sp. HKCCD7318]|uniref:hypothetical protein n=1 Tax=Ruegeria sp. HKCCD7318 TaxID=2683014 RepID=UPI001C11A979|nr:hypothetical protein [Ruegeria sp. HKCCD7318]
MAPRRTKFGTLLEPPVDETRFAVTKTVAPDLVQGGQLGQEGMPVWEHTFWRPSEVVPAP